GGRRGGRLERGEGVRGGPPGQALPYRRRDRLGAIGEERQRGHVVEADKVELEQPGTLECARVADARSEKHRYALRPKPPRREDECFRRRRVEPVSVIDQAEDRLPVR